MSSDGRPTSHGQRLIVRVQRGSQGSGDQPNVYEIESRGVFIRTSEPLAPGSLLQLTLYTPEDLEFVSVDGQVVWTNLVETDQIPMGMGVCFLGVDDEAWEKLKRRLQPL